MQVWQAPEHLFLLKGEVSTLWLDLHFQVRMWPNNGQASKFSREGGNLTFV